jgi:hypothetical protein
MAKMLTDFQKRNAIMRYRLLEEDDRLVVEVWMNGTSYIDEAVRHVRKEIEAAAIKLNRPVSVVIAAVLECFNVGAASENVNHTYHQAVDKAD